jgi:predicted ATPase
MIETFHVQNYKALRDVTLSLTPIHVLIGPNDSGKTSILEALAAHCRLTQVSVADAFQGRWTGLDLVWKGYKDRFVTLEVSVRFGSHRVKHSITCGFQDSNRKSVSVLSEYVSNADTSEIEIRENDSSSASLLRSRTEPVVELLRQELTPCNKYRWIPANFAKPVSYEFASRFGMTNSGFGLPMYLNDIIADDHLRFGSLEQRFCKLFPAVSRIRLRRVPGFANAKASKPRDTGLGLFFEQHDGTTFPASQASDGLLLVLAYLAILYSPTPPRVLLIEEPENGVHPRRLGEVLDVLKELVGEQGKTQILLTTHSPYVVDKFRPKEVTLCLKGADGAAATHRLSESKSVREQIDIFQLGEIWTAEGDEALAAPPAPEEARMP